MRASHVYAVETMLQRSEQLETELSEAVRITQPWQAYTASQVHEAELFDTLLWELVADMPQLPQNGGRTPPSVCRTCSTAMGMKVYSQFSTRRAMSGVREAVAKGRVAKEHCYSTTARYFEREELTPVLRELIQRSALPLKDIETAFAIDSSGFASTAYNRWFEHKWGHVVGKKRGQVGQAARHVRCTVQHRHCGRRDGFHVGRRALSP